ncbi:MAG: PepSY domain-containing protein, partial [Azoarcus sp.]|nr:PepSY domain-containing protein [Azoarcus sp.]
MKDHFRQSMAWWHTWVGLVCGWGLFVIFFTGTAAVFLDAGQHWLRPELHRPAAAGLDARRMVEAAERKLREQGEGGPMWWLIGLPERGSAHFEASWRRQGGWQDAMLDAATGEALAEQP